MLDDRMGCDKCYLYWVTPLNPHPRDYKTQRVGTKGPGIPQQNTGWESGTENTLMNPPMIDQ